MKISDIDAVFSILNKLQVKYLVAGGIAVNVHGYQRLTADLDLIIQLDSHNIHSALSGLTELGYKPVIPVNPEDFANPVKRKEWIEKKNMQVYSLYSENHKETSIDIFVREPFDFELEYHLAPEAELSDEICFKVVSVDTLINMKKEAARPKDLDDIEHLKLILEVQK